MAAPARTLDALTSATLKHVRDDWWDEAFTSFLVERLRPRAGNRILDVGCGTGSVELRLSRLRVPQISLIGIDRLVERAIIAERTTDGHNLRASFSAADACHLPFPDATFDSTFCVAVLQHVADVSRSACASSRASRARMDASSPSNRTTPPVTGTARCPPAWTRSPKGADSSPRWPRRAVKRSTLESDRG